MKVLEIHHHAMRAASGEKSMQGRLHFYRDVLGMEPDSEAAREARPLDYDHSF